ncbi:MAG: hybrid sensor histidine kinase/response regulator [Parvularculaceae bacterium]
MFPKKAYRSAAVAGGKPRSFFRRLRKARKKYSAEFGQSVARIGVTVVIWIYWGVLAVFFPGDDLRVHEMFWVGVLSSLFNAGLLAWFLTALNESHARRVISILSDYVTLSLFLIVGEQTTAPLLVFYLWVIFGNGFRFGVPYMMFSSALSVLSFATVAFASDFWRDQIFSTAGILLSMIVLPIFARQLIITLQSAKQAAEAANESKTRFIAMMSHEIRTPLNAVLGLTDLLSGTPLNSDQRQMVTSLRASGASLMDLVNDVLEYTKIESGAASRSAEKFDFFRLLSTVQAVAYPLARNKGLSFNICIAPRTPQFVCTDRAHLQKILINLVGNAIKYTDTGSVSVQIEPEGATAGGEARLVIEVIDSGVGVAQEELSRIFDRFTQASDPAAAGRGGAGLGLAICADLVKLLGGDIAVESEVGQGSIFRVSFPFDAIGADTGDAPRPQSDPDLAAAGSARAPRLEAVVIGDVGEKFLSRLKGEGVACTRMDCLAGAAAAAEKNSERAVPAFVRLSAAALREVDEALREGGNLGVMRRPVVFVTHNDASGLIDLAKRKSDAVIAADADDDAVRSIVAYVQSVVSFARVETDQRQSSPTKCRALKVLVAEDNEMNRQIAARMLRELGHEPSLAVNGEEALEMMSREDFDLILMDVNMPVVNGLEAAKLCRLGERGGRRTPIAALTADVTRTQRHACLDAGIDTVLHKPITLAVLEAELRKLTGVGRAQDPRLAIGASAPSGTSDAAPGLEARGNGKAAGASELAVLDLERFADLKSLDPNGSFIEKISTAFLADAREMLDEIRASLAAGDRDRLQKARHAMRSSALNIGAERIVELCLDAQTIGEDDVADAGGAFAATLEHELASVRQVLAAQLKRPV